MELHAALDDFKRNRGSPTRFPGERRSTTGRFTGLDDRLVHVSRDGSLRDFSYPLCGLTGIERSRFGVEVDGNVFWLDGDRQRYVDDTAVVETRHDVDGKPVVQYDLAVGRLHLTHLRADDVADVDALYACFAFAPEGRAGRVGQLRHGDAVEVLHHRERDFASASTPIDVGGEIPPRFEEVLSPEPTAFPRLANDDAGRYEEVQLSPVVTAEIGLEGEPPSATVATLLWDEDEDGGRDDALGRVREAASAHDDRGALLAAGREQYARRLPDAGDDELVELRALALLRAPNGARIAGPEFDPFFRNSGGYGYTWFRDDAEIARFLLAADRRADLGLEKWHAASARFYVDTQLADGTWPHRVWTYSGSLAPGWANGRLEDTETAEYQADQTASVTGYLADYLRHVDPDDADVRETVVAAFDGLEATVDDDGLPGRVQNAWENMTGRFAHTTATYLDAYASVAAAPVDDELASRARTRATEVYDGLDALWVPDRETYALRSDDGDLDERLDGSTLALAAAHLRYDAVGEIDGERLDRLVSHVETTLDGLYRDPDGPVEGLARFEDDPWRRREQAAPKIWSVTTAWGAHAALELRNLLAAHDRSEAARFDRRARTLAEIVDLDGSLRVDGGYLPEQVFDDGTPDSATPLGWPHAIVLAARTALEEAEAAVGDTAITGE
ncbi:glucan 1,4-alpha-glucosidase [Halovivax sp.]|uniref:glucan 1,4-alpha-glucosidase n=1 Tax=Halovivax sp. TaxID=1935978 RepID=UPI0025C3127E|nr:glucan 1,4-alpha-glucosidase [Halovivax sp.]